MRIKCFVFIGIMGFALLASCGESAHDRNPPTSTVPDRFSKVRAMIQDVLQKGGAPSLSIAVAEKGNVVWEESFGYADRGKKTVATPDSLYALASISKSMTATGLMVLAERGRLDLDKPVNDYLGEAKLVWPAGDAAQATVKRMIYLEAGMPMHWNIFPTSEPERPPARDESIRRYGIIVNEPGQEYVYSNFAYGVLDQVIARVSGRSYAQFMSEEVFKPLAMSRTAVHVPPELATFTVQNYDEAGKPLPVLAYDHDGASAVYASVHDLIRFGLFHLKSRVPGQKPILRESSLDRLHTPSELRAEGESIGDARMGMGWGVLDLAGVRFVIASGSAPGTMSRLTLIPASNVAVALLCNASLPDEFALWKIEWETFAALVPDFPVRPEIPENKIPAFEPPRELLGEWEGSVRTYQGTLPLKLSVRSAQEISIELDGRPGAPILINTPLGPIGFQKGWLSGLFSASIPTGDAQRSPHVVFLRLKLQGDVLAGTVSAVAIDKTFALPYWASLKRKS